MQLEILTGILKIRSEYGIELEAKDTLKSTWKKHVKKKITEKEEKDIREVCKEKKKARTVSQDKYERKSYLEKASLMDVKKIIKYRLHMSKVPANFKKKGIVQCPLCEEGEGSTEHYFECRYTRYLVQTWEVNKSDLQTQELKKMKDVARFLEKIEEMLQPILYP